MIGKQHPSIGGTIIMKFTSCYCDSATEGIQYSSIFDGTILDTLLLMTTMLPCSAKNSSTKPCSIVFKPTFVATNCIVAGNDTVTMNTLHVQAANYSRTSADRITRTYTCIDNELAGVWEQD